MTRYSEIVELCEQHIITRQPRSAKKLSMASNIAGKIVSARCGMTKPIVIVGLASESW